MTGSCTATIKEQGLHKAGEFLKGVGRDVLQNLFGVRWRHPDRWSGLHGGCCYGWSLGQ